MKKTRELCGAHTLSGIIIQKFACTRANSSSRLSMLKVLLVIYNAYTKAHLRCS